MTTQERCPNCGGPVWDNRPKKERGEFSAKSPDFKCKDKECGGVIWPEKQKKANRHSEDRPVYEHGDDRQNRIERQHSQEMALRYFTLCAKYPTGKLPAAKDLRDMTSWFQRDIQQAPTPEPQGQPEEE